LWIQQINQAISERHEKHREQRELGEWRKVFAPDCHTGRGQGANRATAAAFQDLGSPRFGDESLNLEHQVVLGRVPQRAVEEDQLNAAPP
jgi:hypothetical protein